MIAVYYTILFLVGLLVSPILLFKSKARAGLWQKLGFVPTDMRLNGNVRPIWIHACSVGEFNAVWPLLSEIHHKHPNIPIVVSTTTKTGQEQAKARAGSFAKVFYFPYDTFWGVRAWLNAINPRAVLIVETETWPGFYDACSRRGVPTVVVNGRISPRSFKRFQLARALFGTALAKASLILAQSKEEAARYRDLTGSAKTIVATGNLKFDGLKAISASEQAELRQKLGIKESDVVIVAGSTHEGEETAILTAAKQLKARGKNAKVILVPRHPERFNRAAELIQSHGFQPKKFSKDEQFTEDNDVYLLDAIGHLTRFYAVASIAFVGGTIVKVGGHNLVEPCVYSVPVVCGPYVFKTRDVAQALVASKAIFLSQDANEVIETIISLADDEGHRATVGRAGNVWLAQSLGAVNRSLSSLEHCHDVLSDGAGNPKKPNDLAEAKR